MKIVSWNCNGALRKKILPLRPIEADIFVIQECEDPARASDANYKKWAGDYLWVGKNKNRGLAVFAKNGISLQQIALDAGRLESFIPCVVAGRINLLAAWTRQANSPNFQYIGQLWKWLQLHREFLRVPQSALIGDLNSNTQWDEWDRWWNHSDVVRELEGIGLKSIYHHVRGEKQGGEKTPTFFMHRRMEKPYHIDYAYLSEALFSNAALEIGRPEIWLEHSDHMPLLVDLALTAP